jgi:hypothetical protein
MGVCYEAHPEGKIDHTRQGWWQGVRVKPMLHPSEGGKKIILIIDKN